ncbi:MAG: glycoside hydrolase family 43 protein [Clostridia bacterium]|nr:glycoside hydrolase family 43 protein [Clostridia bacterium]
MKLDEINIRDPFVLCENGKFYMYGTRAASFGRFTHGFDVYVSENLKTWSKPHECFNSEEYSLDREVNWAPEVHKYNGKYYMFATFTKENGLRGTYILRSDSPMGPFVPHSVGAATPENWECLDGTLYVEDGLPYIVFCHEHTQIWDGTICYQRLSEDLTIPMGEPVTLFKASDPEWADPKHYGDHFVTDGPFMFRTKTGVLLMIWSTFIQGKYAECVVRFGSGSISGEIEHLEPILKDDGGHGMIFSHDDRLYLIFHSPNMTGSERPVIREITDTGDSIVPAAD